jgi:virginiamycin B lyase
MRWPRAVLVLGLSTAAFWVGLPVVSQTQIEPSANASLAGTVDSADHQPLEGVAVSARAQGSTITTSVWTNQRGEYYFPPLLDGQYTIWAQAVGFERTQTEQALAASRPIRHTFTLPTYAEVWRQFDDIEWYANLPDNTPEDKGMAGRMKRVIHHNCSTQCHNTGYVLSNRFTAADWEHIINGMQRWSGLRADPPYDGEDITERARNTEYEDEVPGGGTFAIPMLDGDGKPMGAQRRIIEFYKKDLVSYLTRVRGPEPYPINWTPLPRPTGEATNIVITEYDLPEGGTLNRLDPKTGRMTQFTLGRDGGTTRNDNPSYYLNEYRNGSDWSRGSRNQFQELGQHDIKVGRDGYIYLPPGIGRDIDPDGNIWFTGAGGGVKFDVKSETFTPYPLPKGFEGFENGKGVDSQGNFWAATAAGAYKMDPKTGTYVLYPSVTPLGRPYGLTVDREDKAWFAQIAVDKVGWVDGRTGDVGEVVLPPITDEPMTAEDRALNRGWTWNQPLYGRGPRRLQADRNGDHVWVASHFGGYLSKIHIRTKELTDYRLPGPYRFGSPYEPVVDKNGIVWVAMSNADVLTRFDPETEKFTFFPLPTRSTNARNIDVDNTPSVPEVWLPQQQGGKVARVQFRTNPAR